MNTLTSISWMAAAGGGADEIKIVPILAMALASAFLMGKLAHKLHIPKVTGYVVTGLLLGPSAFNIIDHHAYELIHFISDLALGLILFNIGGQFHRKLFKEVGLRTVRFALISAGTVIVCVFIACALLLPFMGGLTLTQSLAVAVFLGFVAVEAAPPTTLLVIKEFQAKGPVTNHIVVFLAIATVIAIVGTEIIKLGFSATGVWPVGENGLILQALSAAWSIVGALLIGTVLGLGLSYWEQHERDQNELLLGVICAILVGLFLADKLHVHSMLMSIFMGFALINSSHSGKEIHASVKGTGMSIYALFFVLAGAHINVQEQFPTVAAAVLVVVYVGARVFGMAMGTRLAARWTGEKVAVGKYSGLGQLSHAGAAIGIVSMLPSGEATAQVIINIVFAAVVVFELAGPLFLRRTLLLSGEVKVGSLISDALSGVQFSMAELVKNFLRNVGLYHDHGHNKDDAVTPMINRKVLSIAASANLETVLKFIDSHHYPIYPVTNKEGGLEGIISIDEMKNVMFDPFLSRLILAQDLIQTKQAIPEDATLEAAHTVFEEAKMEHLPVIGKDTGKYLGSLSHKQVLVLMKGED